MSATSTTYAVEKISNTVSSTATTMLFEPLQNVYSDRESFEACTVLLSSNINSIHVHTLPQTLFDYYANYLVNGSLEQIKGKILGYYPGSFHLSFVPYAACFVFSPADVDVYSYFNSSVVRLNDLISGKVCLPPPCLFFWYPYDPRTPYNFTYSKSLIRSAPPAPEDPPEDPPGSVFVNDGGVVDDTPTTPTTTEDSVMFSPSRLNLAFEHTFDSDFCAAFGHYYENYVDNDLYQMSMFIATVDGPATPNEYGFEISSLYYNSQVTTLYR